MRNLPNIEYLPPGDLKPYPGNARTHSKKQVKQIAESLQTFGFNNPILVSNDNQIIAGHGRVRHHADGCADHREEGPAHRIRPALL